MNQDIFSVTSLVTPVIPTSCGMILAGLLVTLHCTESPQVINTSVATNAIPLKSCISTELVQPTVQFLTSTDTNGTEIFAIILVFTVGISTGMVLASLIVIILLSPHTETANSIVTILALNTSANTFISTKVA